MLGDEEIHNLTKYIATKILRKAPNIDVSQYCQKHKSRYLTEESGTRSW